MIYSFSKFNLFQLAFYSFFLLLVILFIRIYLNYSIDLPLHFDEAQYWGWSKNRNGAIFSKPPMFLDY